MSPQATPFLRAVMGEPGTTQKAACTEVEPELFFPNYNEGGQFAEERAKQVCRTCPLMWGCLEFALYTEDQFAILGGTTPAERQAILRQRSKAA